MDVKINKLLKIRLVLSIILVIILTVSLCLISYQYDNKYTSKGPQADNGLLNLRGDILNEQPLLFLVDGWEYYSNQLLTPEDFIENQPTPDEYIFIGQYGGFDNQGIDNSPHGSASYRMRITLPEDSSTYMLELPEIFSSYKLYINDEMVIQMGNPNPDNYQAETGNRFITIEAAGEIEILFVVSDFSHLYSGMVYPPAFGTPEAVSTLLNSRLIIRSLLCASALVVGILSLLIGFLTKRKSLTTLFGFICLCFIGYVGYPLTRSLSTSFDIPYVIENLCFIIMLGIIMLVTRKICKDKRKWTLCFPLLSVFVSVITLIVHLTLPQSNLQIMLLYSQLITIYEWLSAGFISLSIMLALKRHVAFITPLLYGVIVFDCALIMDRLLPLHEPILTGWFIEIASFILILFIGSYIGKEVALNYRNNAIMSERAYSMERLYNSQTAYYNIIKEEMAKTKIARHDLRHHFTLLDSFVKNKQYQKLSEYVSTQYIETVSGDLPEYCPIDVINVLTYYYHTIAKKSHIDLTIRCDLHSKQEDFNTTKISDGDLCCLYSNLIENAIEACNRVVDKQTYIRIAIVRPTPDILMIHVWNPTDQKINQSGKSFLSSKRNEGSGYGMMSVQSIVEKYNGSVTFTWDKDKQEFESNISLEA
ncbi:MAG: sensor histidine kinase [Coprobacillaceae bacterium]